ncbi:phosphopentomutase [Paracoccus suum]|uniref:Phosphopentomutase n=1 Tax=Paracoccus suum TaxID=2259340 RepID=A0A344PKA4_9RHOB|nr:phosphopentomutase [Paracoccus suum]AXC49809.1 phosphopentomutase [Paracoccus suum]
MSRAFLIVMDSVGIGGAPDAGAFFNGTRPDTGANTLAHIAAQRPLRMPNLDRLGLGAALALASGARAPGLGAVPEGLWGAATEVSHGKDTPTGHWELAGVPTPWEWRVFPDSCPAFPESLTDRITALAGVDGVLGNAHASGTEVIERLGSQHMQTGWPIVYTSADSVIQIAAHEESFGLQRLLDLCAALAPEVHAMRVGRVIARPFIGGPGSFQRTAHRRDFAAEPPAATILERTAAAGRATHAIGKIGDIFSMRGIGKLWKGDGDAALADHLLSLAGTAEDGSLTFANFVEFDSRFGHRRDVAGYASALEWFDQVAGEFLARLRPGDLAIFTADHGNDPSWSGTDHTRERVPVLGWGVGPRAIGLVSFADVGASVAAHLGLAPTTKGSFLDPQD